MKKLFLLAMLCLLSAALYAQSPPGITRFTLQGRAVDTSSVPLPSSTVMLLSAKDSSLVNFTRAGDNGAFAFKNIKVGNYVLKISYVGLIPYNAVIKPATEAVMDLGALKLKPITRELMEVVVRTAKAPLTIKGDTIEYNASSFKVPPGSTVEDLLRKLPGVQIDQDGNIRAQGQDVKKLTVDGKNFFGNDPKQATKNLQAEAITKVQVFNDKTEQAKLTGVDDGKKEKTINLELKEEFKKGGFGKVTAAGGPASNNVSARAEAKGIYNKFNAKHQFSLVGLGNNTNQQGLSRDDYQDFRGSNAYNSNQNADFGFSGGGFFYFSDSGDEGLGIPVSGRQGVGFSNNAAGGANYNFDTKEKKWSGSYYYNQTRLELDAQRLRDVTLPQSTYSTNETSNQVNFNGNHRVSLRYEKQLDTLNTLIFINNSRYGVGNARLFRIQDLTRSNGAATHNESTNASDQRQFATSNSFIFRHKMHKKGRSIAASATYEVNTNNANLILDSENTYSGPITAADKSADIHQDQRNDIVRSEYKASLQYVEPFAKRFTWETFFNFSLRYDEVDRDVFNRGDSRYVRNDTLSLYYKNNYVYNRLGSSVRYSYKGLNVSAGLAGQRFTLNGQFAPDQTSATFTPISRVFTTMIPNIGLNYDLKKNRYLYVGYNVSVQIPTSRDLQPVRNNSNPLYINQGNPNLLPQLGHNVNAYFNYFNPGNFINAYISLYGTKYVNQIVYSQKTDPQTLVTVITPENLSGGQNLGSYLGFGFPLKKTKATLDLNVGVGSGNTPARINDVINDTRFQNYNAGTRLSLTPADWLTFYANANFSITNNQFSISSNRNQIFTNNNFSGDLNLKLPHDLYINTSLNYRINKNEQLNFDQRIPIWNASVYHILGKAKRAEIRLTAVDMLNRNVAVTLNRGVNYTQSETIQTLARYFTIGFTYNMRGVQTKIRRDGFY
ncbi:outer membrane beta-barrel protein [Spirosoma radiotolerans]|uniref:TonB-dependent receptor n=1 Tax=Spirosoma radiotolerans TaxID=1379870 RepID=A0A0E3ZYB7_9BACT|nr:outer membrane beta-barrel protein [Spirosoma radiotolerans]AKD56724.1 TonB-dependent receptor [Spirosoma radiotolerans]